LRPNGPTAACVTITVRAGAGLDAATAISADHVCPFALKELRVDKITIALKKRGRS